MSKILTIFIEDNNESEDNFLSDDTKEFDDFFDGSLTTDEREIALTISYKKFMRIQNDQSEYEKLINKLEEDLAIEKEYNFIDNPENAENTINEMKTKGRKDFFKEFEFIRLDLKDNFKAIPLIKELKKIFGYRKIVLPNIYTLEESCYNQLSDFSKIISTIIPEEYQYLIVYDNSALVPINDYKASYKMINDIVNLVRSLNLSPLEEIMFVYDILKKRRYTKEDDNEDALVSRDLVSSLLGDKIVCAGFNSIFSCILKLLGHKVTSIALKELDGDEAHIRSVIHVDDPKYNVIGLYFFDVTWDSKKTCDLSDYNRYRNFLKTLDEMLKIDKMQGLFFHEDSYLYSDLSDKFLESLPDTYKELEFISMKGKLKFNRFLKLMGEEEFKIKLDNNKKSELKAVYEKIKQAFNHQVDEKDISRLIYNVRKVEYYLNPNATPFSIEDLCSSVLSYLSVRNRLSKKEIIFMRDILKIDEKKLIEIEQRKICEKVYDENTPKKIAGIKLTRALRSYSIMENKKNSN